MKFFTITVISLSLGAQVLAAPIDVPSVPGVEGHAVSVPTEALSAVEALPEVGTVKSVLPNSVPSVKKAISITTITGAVSGLHSSVSSELSSITSMASSKVSAVAVPAIKNHLATIATKMNETTFTMAPVLTGPATAISADEKDALITALGAMESICTEIRSKLSSTVSAVSSDTMNLVKPEVAAVLALVLPLVGPLTAFAYSVAGLVPGGDAAIAEVTAAAGAVTGAAGTLLSPVEGVLGGIP